MTQELPLITLRQAKAPFFVGVDLGGTSTKVGVVDDEGRPLARLSVPTLVERGPEDAIRAMAAAIHDAVREAGLEESAVARVGLGSPGILDFRKGIMVIPTNFPGWGGFPIRDRLAEHCGFPVPLVNDASAAAFGELWVGSGRGFHSLVFLTLGTGVGCGVIIGDLIIEGENGHGTECGHIVVDPAENAPVCSCGMTGHLEAYASATAVVRRTREALASGAPSSLNRRLAEGAELTTLLVAEEAQAGDALATQIIMDTARWLAIGIVTLMHTIDPTGVLLGGAMTFGGNQWEIGRRFLDRIRQEVKPRTFPMLAERTRIDFAVLGNEAGYIGAAGIARLELRKAR